ncbi:hypothetical protein [Clostridium rectalis]|uniref:hypothetical protein n=1 Tax=Clostridium rectalis TaxID=2040295 RepID=UPI000F639773|nr:hypothetical protein [Clostridium rectalis]
MEILSQEYNSKKNTKSNKTRLKVTILGKTWIVKKEAYNRWNRFIKLKNFLNSISDAVSVIFIIVTGYVLLLLL